MANSGCVKYSAKYKLQKEIIVDTSQACLQPVHSVEIKPVRIVFVAQVERCSTTGLSLLLDLGGS